MAFRFAYKSGYRSLWDRGELTDLVLVLRATASDLRSLPDCACARRSVEPR